jgi:sugar O-acyltransferase (sialic acid O-acetyltransferase NeuD family)
MKKALIGAGGFADEVKAHMGEYDLISFVDDLYYSETDKNTKPLSQFNPNEWEVLIAIGDPIAREELSKRLPIETKYFTFIHPSVLILGNDVEIGEGSVVCAGVIVTTNCIIGKHTHLNLHTTIGHDCRIGNYFTTAPGVKISGNNEIGECVYIGTNASTKQKLKISDNVIIGMNAAVAKDIIESGTYVGIPAKKIK